MKQWFSEIGHLTVHGSDSWERNIKQAELCDCASLLPRKHFQSLNRREEIQEEPIGLPERRRWNSEFSEIVARVSRLRGHEKRAAQRRQLQRSAELPLTVFNWVLINMSLRKPQRVIKRPTERPLEGTTLASQVTWHPWLFLLLPARVDKLPDSLGIIGTQKGDTPLEGEN